MPLSASAKRDCDPPPTDAMEQQAPAQLTAFRDVDAFLGDDMSDPDPPSAAWGWDDDAAAAAAAASPSPSREDGAQTPVAIYDIRSILKLRGLEDDEGAWRGLPAARSKTDSPRTIAGDFTFTRSDERLRRCHTSSRTKSKVSRQEPDLLDLHSSGGGGEGSSEGVEGGQSCATATTVTDYSTTGSFFDDCETSSSSSSLPTVPREPQRAGITRSEACMRSNTRAHDRMFESQTSASQYSMRSDAGSPGRHGRRNRQDEQQQPLRPRVAHSTIFEKTGAFLSASRAVMARKGKFVEAVFRTVPQTADPEIYRAHLLPLCFLLGNPFAYLEESVFREARKLNCAKSLLRRNTTSSKLLQTLFCTVLDARMKEVVESFAVSCDRIFRNFRSWTESSATAYFLAVQKVTKELLDACGENAGLQLLSYVVFKALKEGLQSNPNATTASGVSARSLNQEELESHCRQVSVVNAVVIKFLAQSVFAVPVQMGVLSTASLATTTGFQVYSQFLTLLSENSRFKPGSPLEFLNPVKRRADECLYDLVLKLTIKGRGLYHNAEFSFDIESAPTSVRAFRRFVASQQDPIARNLTSLMKKDCCDEAMYLVGKVLKRLVRLERSFINKAGQVPITPTRVLQQQNLQYPAISISVLYCDNFCL